MNAAGQWIKTVNQRPCAADGEPFRGQVLAYNALWRRSTAGYPFVARHWQYVAKRPQSFPFWTHLHRPTRLEPGLDHEASDISYALPQEAQS
jgi:hypothetical protein